MQTVHQGALLTLFVCLLLVCLAAASADGDAAIAEHQAVQTPPAAVELDSLAAVGCPASFVTAHQHQHAERHHQQVDPVDSRALLPLVPLVPASGLAVSQAADFAADAALTALLPAGPAPGPAPVPALTVVAGSATVRGQHAAVVLERAVREVWVASPGTLVAAKRSAGPELAQRIPSAPSQHIAAWLVLPAVRLTRSIVVLELPCFPPCSICMTLTI